VAVPCHADTPPSAQKPRSGRLKNKLSRTEGIGQLSEGRRQSPQRTHIAFSTVTASNPASYVRCRRSRVLLGAVTPGDGHSQCGSRRHDQLAAILADIPRLPGAACPWAACGVRSGPWQRIRVPAAGTTPPDRSWPGSAPSRSAPTVTTKIDRHPRGERAESFLGKSGHPGYAECVLLPGGRLDDLFGTHTVREQRIGVGLDAVGIVDAHLRQGTVEVAVGPQRPDQAGKVDRQLVGAAGDAGTSCAVSERPVPSRRPVLA
jgi:hypothetical protein